MAKIVTVRLEEDLHKPARTRIAELDTSFQAVLTGLLRGWVSGTPGTQDSPTPGLGGGNVSEQAKYRPEHRKWHDLLEFIFVKGTADQAGWIQGNIKTFADLVRAQRKLKPSEITEIQDHLAVPASGHGSGSDGAEIPTAPVPRAARPGSNRSKTNRKPIAGRSKD